MRTPVRGHSGHKPHDVKEGHEVVARTLGSKAVASDKLSNYCESFLPSVI